MITKLNNSRLRLAGVSPIGQECPAWLSGSGEFFLRGLKMSKRIPITQGQYAIVDDEDYEWLNQWKWQARKYRDTFYVRRQQWLKAEKKNTVILMHRQILKAKKGEDVDHIDHNPLDNRKTNIRICTRSQNMANRGSTKNASSKYKGVFWSKNCKKWIAQIQHNYKRMHLGCFCQEIEAAKAYDRKAKKLFGEYAYLNFNEQKEMSR